MRANGTAHHPVAEEIQWYSLKFQLVQEPESEQSPAHWFGSLPFQISVHGSSSKCSSHPHRNGVLKQLQRSFFHTHTVEVLQQQYSPPPPPPPPPIPTRLDVTQLTWCSSYSHVNGVTAAILSLVPVPREWCIAVAKALLSYPCRWGVAVASQALLPVPEWGYVSGYRPLQEDAYCVWLSSAPFSARQVRAALHPSHRRRVFEAWVRHLHGGWHMWPGLPGPALSLTLRDPGSPAIVAWHLRIRPRHSTPVGWLEISASRAPVRILLEGDMKWWSHPIQYRCQEETQPNPTFWCGWYSSISAPLIPDWAVTAAICEWWKHGGALFFQIITKRWSVSLHHQCSSWTQSLSGWGLRRTAIPGYSEWPQLLLATNLQYLLYDNTGFGPWPQLLAPAAVMAASGQQAAYAVTMAQLNQVWKMMEQVFLSRPPGPLGFRVSVTPPSFQPRQLPVPVLVQPFQGPAPNQLQ